ncbi:MAG: tetratricopeptide repeat protein [Candidatus Sericytochromatia bacterium]
MKSKFIGLLLVGGLLSACSPSAEQLYEQANAHFAKDQFEEAIPLYEQLQLKDANNTSALAKLTMSYSFIRLWQKCTDAGEQAFERKIDLMELYLRVGDCYENQNQIKQALKTYQEGIKRYPDVMDLKEKAAPLLFAEGQYVQAADYYKLLAVAYPEREDFLLNIGYSLDKQKAYAEAESYFNKVLAINSQESNALYGLASLYEHQNQIPKAISFYTQTLKLNPNHLSALYNLAQLYEQNNQKSEAVKTWKTYIQAAKGKPNQKAFLAKAETQLKQLQGGAS